MPVERTAGTRRIVLLGDSFTFGFGVEDGEVISAALEDLLNTSTCGSGCCGSGFSRAIRG